MKRLIDAFKWSFFTTSMKVVAMLYVNKVLAISFGPGGYFMVGNFQNFVQITQNISLLATNNSLVTSISQAADAESQDKAIETVLSIVLMSSVTVGILCFVFSDDLAAIIFSNTDQSSLFKIYSLALTFNCLFSVFMSKANGLRLSKVYGLYNVTASASLVVLCALFDLVGHETLIIISLGVYQAISFMLLILLPKRLTLLNFSNSHFKLDKYYLGVVKNFAIMAIVSAASVPISHYFVRFLISEFISAEAASGWEAMMRLSVAYLIVVMATFNLYFLPTLSTIETKAQFQRERWNGIRLLFPLYLCGALSLYTFSGPIISTLFTDEFHLIVFPYLGWFLVSDLVRCYALFYVYLMLAKKMTLIFCISEIIGSIILSSCIWVAINNQWNVGLMYFFYTLLYTVCLKLLIKNSRLLL